MITRLIISLSSHTKIGAERGPNSIIVIFSSLEGITLADRMLFPSKKRKKKTATAVVLSELSHSAPGHYASFYHPAGRGQIRAGPRRRKREGRALRAERKSRRACDVLSAFAEKRAACPPPAAVPPPGRPAIPSTQATPPDLFRARTRAEHERSLLAFARRRSREDVSSVL